MLYVVGVCDGHGFERQWHVGEGLPAIKVEDVTELQADGDEQNYVNNLLKRHNRSDWRRERNDSLPDAQNHLSPVWKGNDAKMVWGLMLEHKNDARVIKKVEKPEEVSPPRFGILINPTEPAKSRKFVAYEVREIQEWGKGPALMLSAVYEMSYPHPDAPEQAVHPKLETHELMRVSKGQMLYNAVYVVFAAQESLKQILAGSTK